MFCYVPVFPRYPGVPLNQRQYQKRPSKRLLEKKNKQIYQWVDRISKTPKKNESRIHENFRRIINSLIERHLLSTRNCNQTYKIKKLVRRPRKTKLEDNDRVQQLELRGLLYAAQVELYPVRSKSGLISLDGVK